jgi:hypothetical protein
MLGAALFPVCARMTRNPETIARLVLGNADCRRHRTYEERTRVQGEQQLR